jgi:hypothetical protein
VDSRREDHTAVIITLGILDEDDEPIVLRLATGERQVGDDLFLGKLRENDPLKLSLLPAQDGCTLKVDNTDMLFGQQLTSASEALDGATAILGLIIVDKDTGDAWFDPKMPGDIIGGQVDEIEVPLNFIGEIYAAQVIGETDASVFPYQSTPAANGVITGDPDDLRDPNRDPGSGDIFPIRGRLPDDPTLGFLHV